MARPKQQHFVTKAYLQGFLRPGEKRLQCYGRRRTPFARLPEDLASQRDYYAVKKGDGSWDDSVEHILGNAVESPGLPVLQKLVSGDTRLSRSERKSLALLIAFQETRTPAAREKARELSKLLNDKIIRDVRRGDPEQNSIKLCGELGAADVTLEQLREGHDVVCDDHAMDIHRMLGGAALKVAEVYDQLKFTVLFAAGQAEFITSDSPVIRVFQKGTSTGAGLYRPDLEVRFPLARKAFLTLTHDVSLALKLMRAGKAQRKRLLDATPEIRVRQIPDAEVLALNKGHARHAHRWIYAAGEVDWAADLLAEPSMTPRLMDLSGGDLMHFQSRVTYDPRMDLASE